jgi:transcriptional regulator with XRE-family HTH domain
MDAEELKAARTRAGLTQLALANRLGVDPQTVSRWERGERGISQPMERLIRLKTKGTRDA